MVQPWASMAADAGEFESIVRPFLRQHCQRCHGAGRNNISGVRLDDLKGLADGKDAAPVWGAVLEQLRTEAMPPEGEPPPPREHAENVIGWIEQSLGEPPLADDDRGGPAGGGNRVNHAALFTEPPTRKAATPARLWRISPHVFKESVNALAHRPLLQAKRNQGGDGLHPALPFMTPEHSFRDFAPPHAFEDATTELLADMALLVAGYQLDPRRAPRDLRGALQAEAPGRTEYAAAIRYQFRVALHRDPEPAEVDGLVDLAERTERDAGVTEALRTALAAVLLKPEAVFRLEVGHGEPDEHGRVLLSPREISFAISYALTDLGPDERLLAAKDEGRLITRDDVRREVERILRDPTIEKPRILRFFREYFEYDRAPGVFKDAREPKNIFATERVDDADRLILHVLEEDRDVVKRLLTTDRYFVMGGGLPGREPPMLRARRTYLPDFGLPEDWAWTDDQPVKPIEGRRSGILTHPAWLLAFSDNEKNQAIQRGRWVHTKLLGGTVPDVPIGVDAQLPTDPSLTLREKMRVTRQEYCWSCHRRMDPLGLPFEQFDDFGRFRSEELGRPVDTHGAIAIDDPGLDGPVRDPFEMLARMADSRRVQQVFVRHAFRYWMGRDEVLDDAPTLIDAERAYSEGGGSMKALIASLLTSDSFLYRRLPPAGPPKDE